MDSIFSVTNRLNAELKSARRMRFFFDFLQMLLCGVLGVNIWSFIEPGRTAHHWIFGLGVFLLVFLFKRSPKKEVRLTTDEVAMGLEIEWAHQKKAESFKNLPSEGNGRLSQAGELIKELKDIETLSLKRHLASLVLPFVLFMGTIPQAMGTFKGAIAAVSNVAHRLNRGATLTILHGAHDPLSNQKPVALTPNQPRKIELLAQNLVKIDVVGMGAGDQSLTLELRKIQDERSSNEAENSTFQSFQMLSQKSLGDAEDLERRTIAFSVTENLALFIPKLSNTKPLAQFDVKQLPVPLVTLDLDGKPQDPWPDDQILPLKIAVKATFPIQLVRILIKAGQQTSSVLVANVVSEDKLELTLDYKLLLESYVEADFAQVEIIAEAIDHAVPTPLIGRSNPLMINTASAYGRYREALGIIRSIKSLIDDAIEKDQAGLDPEVLKLTTDMIEKSEKTPFFDGLDRMHIGRFATQIEEYQESKKMPILLDLSQKVNDFLFDHEIIDDRERDRDFFVAARSLSRLLEQPVKKRLVALNVIDQRLMKYLDERLARWEMRVDRLPKELVPSQYIEVKEGKKFHQAISESIKLDELAQNNQEKKSQQLTLLSKAVVEYRKWIQDLESAEDKARSQQEKERQEGLANARNVLKELQKRQGEVSTEIDRANERSKEDLGQAWGGARLKQNTNIKETRRVESQLRSLSPTAGVRIQYAIEAMEQTNQAGDQAQYVEAETNADLAGRLLRQADAAAQESQQKRRSRGGRRRVTGDRYYGQSVVGGDIEIRREYEVDRKYREDILDDVEATQVDEGDRKLLENYLRSIVR